MTVRRKVRPSPNGSKSSLGLEKHDQVRCYLVYYQEDADATSHPDVVDSIELRIGE